MRSLTAIVAVVALVIAPIGIFVPPPEATPSRIILARWGEFDQQRILAAIDPLAVLIAVTERTSLQ